MTHWDRIGLRPHHGISVPLFAIGDFLSLCPLIDWCQEIGFDTIQLLPLNDTGGAPSPYTIVSSLALDPKYLRNKNLHKNASDTTAYQAFCHENESWLPFYARYKGGDHESHMFVQFLCFSEMAKVKAYASQKKINLMGDLPLFVMRESADVAQHPHLFHSDLHAGAPPDFYNPDGQNWGFPIFNYEAMEKDDFHWWKQKLHCAEKIYHIYRIDHVIGLFRTWSVEGHFIPSDPNEWPRLGKKTLEHLLSFSKMFPIAEDLGVMTSSMRGVLKQMQICTTKVMRWELKTPLKNYDPFSMTTLSTHDMEPTPLWWKNHPEEAAPLAERKGWAYHPTLTSDQILSLLQDAHSTSSYFHINPLQEYLYLFPELHSPNWDHERINTPGVVSSENWSYRFHPPLETIIKHPGLKKAMKTLTRDIVSD